MSQWELNVIARNEYKNLRILKEIGFFINEHDMDGCENLTICHLKLGVRKDTLALHLLIPKHSLHIERTVLLEG
jgi:hypothetical protein